MIPSSKRAEVSTDMVGCFQPRTLGRLLFHRLRHVYTDRILSNRGRGGSISSPKAGEDAIDLFFANGYAVTGRVAYR